MLLKKMDFFTENLKYWDINLQKRLVLLIS